MKFKSLLFADWVIFHAFFVKINFLEKKNSGIPKYQNTFRVLNSLDSDQARHFVGPNLGPNYLRRLLLDDNSR